MTVSSGESAASWWEANTFHVDDTTAGALGAATPRPTVCVLIPLESSETDSTDAIASCFAVEGLVDEVVLVVRGCQDHTPHPCVRVLAAQEVFSKIPLVNGRGELLWRGLAATTADIVVVVDPATADRYAVARLLYPLLTDPTLGFVSGFGCDADEPGGLGVMGSIKVTELLVRPLTAAICPELTGVVEPLSTEWAARRNILEALRFAVTDGVDAGLVVDVARRFGIDAVAQSELTARRRSPADTDVLGPLARQVVATVLDRMGIGDDGAPLTQFVAVGDEFRTRRWYPVTVDRPALSTLRAVPGGVDLAASAG